MKESLINRIQSLIGESNLQFKRWDTLINLYVLPKVAGSNGRKCISDDFLNLVADYASEICAKDSYIAGAILEICLQRLANGAIPANISISMDNLPHEYKEYSSAMDKPYPMTGGCLNFLMNGLEFAFYNAETRNHATMILFTFVEQISPTGRVKNKEKLVFHPELLDQELFAQMFPEKVNAEQKEEKPAKPTEAEHLTNSLDENKKQKASK